MSVLERRSKGRTAQDYTIIVAYDGEKTEDEYFRGWKLAPPARLTLVPIFVTSGGNPLRAVQSAIKKMGRLSGFAEFWCVSDCDGATDQCIAEAAAEAARVGIKLCLSNRCFEVWLALHWQRSERPITNEQEAVDLVRQFYPEYSRQNKAVPFLELLQRTDQAISNAKWLAARGHNNPSTKVHALARKLKQNSS